VTAVMLLTERLWHHIPLAIFVNLSLGATGVPGLTESLLVSAGVIAVNQGGSSLCVLASAVAGSTVGMSWTFLAGRAIDRHPPRWLRSTRLQQALSSCQRFGAIAVGLGYFVPGLRHATAFAAGVSAMRRERFVAASIVGACAWSSALLWIGHWMGHHAAAAALPRSMIHFFK